MADETHKSRCSPRRRRPPGGERKSAKLPRQRKSDSGSRGPGAPAAALALQSQPPGIGSRSPWRPAASTEAPKPTTASRKPIKKDEKKDGAAPVALSLDETIEPLKVVKAKGSKNVTHGIAHVQASFNNTIVSITDQKGAVIGWSSAGKCGFKGSRKSTAYAAQMVAQDACRQAMSHGLREVEVRVKGPGAGRESAVRAMQAVGLEITVIRDVTPVPHNGCRPPKQRRV